MAATVCTAAAQSSSVVRLPQKRLNTSAMALPAIIARARSEAMAPATQTASRPSSSRKYGCQAYQAQAMNPYCRSETSINRRTGRSCHPKRSDVRATLFISAGTVVRRRARGVNPRSRIANQATPNTPTSISVRSR